MKRGISMMLLVSAGSLVLGTGFWFGKKDPASKDARFIVRRPEVPRPISPLVYGMAAAPGPVLRTLRVPLNRWGGNTASRYNWQLANAWNTGSDWFFMNVAIEADAWQGFLRRTRDAGATAILTLPLVGYVARDTHSHSFSVERYGPQQKHAPGRPDAGNGVLPDGRPLYGNDPGDANRRADPEFVAAWLRSVKRLFPDLATDGRLIVALGNEPMLWNKTHRDVHPEPVTYDEYLARFIAMARMVRRELPGVKLAGPELWGWPALFESARDRDEGRGLDRKAHGKTPFLPWFLERLKAHEETHGECLLDIVTVHYYPQAEGVHSEQATPGHQLRRIAATRSLFDPSYKDPSWIDRRIRLVPRLREWIADAYPGRMLGITEYNWGAENDISGAIALADALGIMGQQQVDLACYWTTPPEASPASRAYALYRNADGRGAAFGNRAWGVRWNGDGKQQYEACALYAAELPEREILTLLAINKTLQARKLLVRTESGPWRFKDGFMLSAGATNGIERIPDTSLLAIEETNLMLLMQPRCLYHLRLELRR